MPAVCNPVVTIVVKLPRRMHLRCVVWPDMASLRANTPEMARKDYSALFLQAEPPCVGTIHLAQTEIRNGTRAHEISHAMDHFVYLLMSELRADTTERVTNEIDRSLRKAGLI